MTLHTTATLRRPKLLWRAARAGVGKLPLEILIKRVLGPAAPSDDTKLQAALLEKESQWEEQRVERRPDYAPSGHVLCMIALISLGRSPAV